MNPWKLFAPLLLVSIGSAHAALTLTIANGDFETDVAYNMNSGTADSSVGGGWFESSTAVNNFNDFIANTDAAVFDPQLHNNGNALFITTASSYIYQSLGTIGTETAATFTFDALERVLNNNEYTVTIELFASSTFVGANGTDVEGAAGVTALGFGSYRYASGDGSVATDNDQNGVQIANLSLAGAASGDQIWVKISTPRPAGDTTLQIDNLSVSYVPEPSSAALLALAGLALVGRRRRP